MRLDNSCFSLTAELTEISDRSDTFMHLNFFPYISRKIEHSPDSSSFLRLFQLTMWRRGPQVKEWSMRILVMQPRQQLPLRGRREWEKKWRCAEKKALSINKMGHGMNVECSLSTVRKRKVCWYDRILHPRPTSWSWKKETQMTSMRDRT